MSRWSPEQVAAAAPSPAALSASRPLTTTATWGGLGADDRAVWGSCRGSGAEPYDTMVDHVGVGFGCTCPSRRRPCKHALALAMLWSNGDVAESDARPAAVDRWLAPAAGLASSGAGAVAADTTLAADAGTATTTSSTVTSEAVGAGSAATGETAGAGSDLPDDVPEVADEPPGDRDRGRDERVERMHAGLTELDRWLDDRIRTGLADPSLAEYRTWDQLAARLVDAQAGSLANRIRRLAGLVGASPNWHSDVLAELGLLHLLSQAGRRLGSLPGPLADAVATTVGWQVRQADILGGVPDTDTWVVAGRSDTREDRIEVRRIWLRGQASGQWAMVLSFAAYRQSLDTSFDVGTSFAADLHRYPGPALRALVGERHGGPIESAVPPSTDIGGACDQVGAMLAAEPWLDRVPFTATAAVAADGSGFALTDLSGSLRLIASGRPLATLLAVAGGDAVDVTCEWTPHGVVPLAIHLADRTLDIGPRADTSFVSAA